MMPRDKKLNIQRVYVAVTAEVSRARAVPGLVQKILDEERNVGFRHSAAIVITIDVVTQKDKQIR